MEKQLLQQIETVVDARVKSEIQGAATQLQGVLDAMHMKWQGDLQAATAEHKRATAEHNTAAKRTLFAGLFDRQRAEVEAALDNETLTARQLQKTLYKACDGAVAELNPGGKTARYRHLTDIEVATGFVGAMLTGIGVRAVAVRGMLYLKQRRERKAQESAQL